jgi:hypothetical protein
MASFSGTNDQAIASYNAQAVDTPTIGVSADGSANVGPNLNQCRFKESANQWPMELSLNGRISRGCAPRG